MPDAKTYDVVLNDAVRYQMHWKKSAPWLQQVNTLPETAICTCRSSCLIISRR